MKSSNTRLLKRMHCFTANNMSSSKAQIRQINPLHNYISYYTHMTAFYNNKQVSIIIQFLSYGILKQLMEEIKCTPARTHTFGHALLHINISSANTTIIIYSSYAAIDNISNEKFEHTSTHTIRRMYRFATTSPCRKRKYNIDDTTNNSLPLFNITHVSQFTKRTFNTQLNKTIFVLFTLTFIR